MARAQVFNPAKDSRSDALRRAREAAERRKQAEEVAEAIKAQALARDPAQAGIDMHEAQRQGVIVDFHPGTTKVKRAERRGTGVFEALAATLAQGERDAGNDLVEIYARRMGRAGRQTEEIGFHDKGTPDREWYTADMQSARLEWERHMEKFGMMSIGPKLLEDLCADVEFKQGRWRERVQFWSGETNLDRQGSVVKGICRELHAIMTGEKPY